ncbi:hypothetical protein DFP91_5496 [Pseudorhodoplanes sinuspersici]|uniref:Uncharacterized protein n=1 Tax=Pseudorhodoplanes sinuspersici TaxID=1235591 RepID=A0A1W6ZS11_9HYPH|nr:hypothetical protein CAK95_14445 [Pseudorhodoplanes sinuspersici]RKE67726.1 hypothetical protein DFP91_5496 [Pseudorhodoplanes sinuspersici]
MNSVRDAGIGTAVVIGVATATGMDAVGTGAVGMGTAGMGTAGMDTAGMGTGIGVLAVAGMYGVMAIGSVSAADGRCAAEPGKPRLMTGAFSIRDL